MQYHHGLCQVRPIDCRRFQFCLTWWHKSKLWQQKNKPQMLKEIQQCTTQQCISYYRFFKRRDTQVKVEVRRVRCCVRCFGKVCVACIYSASLKVIVCHLRRVCWVSLYSPLSQLSSFPNCLSPSFSCSKQHITLTDSSNHSTMFAWQIQNGTDTQLIGWRGFVWRRGNGARN